ncbi:MurR/RpiR family transcriptional regulator [Tetragenococcus muriaticus]|uniref:Transcription regulator n=2 Tax=Tetragenococcus muriaticus TaxID=64642 RepID=A0A091C5I0_9ENTE|nr:MurR/RpiR family transcriptional regulator [Tetragenococcus muriaticus]KFN91362.1 transcription regulator [Tetragenococcus muriaticus 3MR10-3]KFN91815.1 transcription regulator [Tetragenococcus muriaticus PMC-11-5]GMA47312.1 RpiR family transcriptional regulator [Tetragenococcus muriaticus]
MSGGLVLSFQDILNHYQTEDTEYIITQYLLNHLYRKSLTITDIAKFCHLSEASVTRFAKKLGYKGFSEFKKDYFLMQLEENEMELDLLAKKEKQPLMISELQTVSEELTNFVRQFDTKQLEEVSHKIQKSQRIYLFSTLIPGNLSMILQTILLNCGKEAVYPVDNRKQHEIIPYLKSSDLAIIISLEGSLVMQKDLTLSIINSKADNLLITQNPHMKLSSLFETVISLGEHDMERTGKYKLLAFIELLGNQYMIENKKNH